MRSGPIDARAALHHALDASALLRVAFVALAASLEAEPVRAYCGDPAYVSSSTEVCTINGCVSSFDFDDAGAPAVSSRSGSAQYVDISYNFGATPP